MSSYRYRCSVCGITWNDVTTKRQAEEERDRHRREVHDGGAPDGDVIQAQDAKRWPGRGTLVAGLLIALLLLYSSRHGQ